MVGIAVTALSLGFRVARSTAGDARAVVDTTSATTTTAEKLDQLSAAAYRDTSPRPSSPSLQQQQQKHQQDSATAPRVADAGGASSELAFVALNDYTRRGDVVGSGYPWLQGKVLVEPHRATSLEVMSPLDGMSYSWEVYQNDGEAGRSLVAEYVGEVVEVVFANAPQYTIVLREYAETAGTGVVVSRVCESEVFCRYVRREIRSLFDDERNEMFDVMKVCTVLL